MATQNLIPGIGFVNETISKQSLIPGAGYVTETVSAGGSLNVSATTDALTLAEHAATIGKSLNIAATTDSLTLAEHAATVSLVSGLNVNATTDALTLAEHAATIGLSLNVQATTDALTLAEYPASLGNTLDVQATTDALVLAEYAATIGLSLGIAANTDALTLTEYGATISDGTVVPVTPAAPAGGGRGAKRKAKYPRRIRINGTLYTVKSEAEEKRLLEQWRQSMREQAAITEHLGETDLAQAITRKALRIQKRIATVDDARIQRLRDDDEEILAILLAA